jgi:hypothetical protein
MRKSSFTLVVEPICGLCNRMRVVDSALAMTRKVGGNAHIIWYSDPDLNCRFTDLFQPLDRAVRFWQLSLPACLEKGFKRMTHFFLRRMSGCYLQPHEVQQMKAAGYDFSELLAHRFVVLKTWDRFCRPEHRFADFRPVPTLQAIIDRQSAGLADAVGVHIRRTDCTAAIDKSPTEKFIAEMRREVATDPGVRFFVATDDPREENVLEQAFPGRIRTYRKRTLSRNRRAGIEDAVVDLYCLARCRKILGSYQSSFSETAAALGSLVSAGRPR